jgi:1-acyl-sn-glycerol-3-phosphate acyltransferase
MCFKVPVVGRFLWQAGHVPVVDGNGRAAFERAVELLKAGRTVVIFPEGALSPLEGGVCPPHTGVARLALITGAPVIPVGIHLQREHIHFRETTVDGKSEVARWYFHGPYAVTVGDPMRFEGDVEDHELVRSVSQRIMQRIAWLACESEERIRKSQAFDPRATQPVRLVGAH